MNLICSGGSRLEHLRFWLCTSIIHCLLLWHHIIYNTLLPAVIECKPGPAVITRPTKYTLLEFWSGCGSRDITAVSAGMEMNSSHSTAGMLQHTRIPQTVLQYVCLSVLTPDYNWTRQETPGIADRPYDWFVQYATDPLKHAPSHTCYATPNLVIWSPGV